MRLPTTLGLLFSTLVTGCATEPGFDFGEVDDVMSADTKGDGSTDAAIIMGSLSKDRPVEGRFLPAGKFAAYTFEKRAGVIVRVSVDALASGDDSVLAIYGPRTAGGWGPRLAESDDAPGHGTDSVVANLQLPADGKYVAIVAEANKRPSGAFTILLETNEVDLGIEAPTDALTGQMVRIPEGAFLFGCNEAIDDWCREVNTGENPLTTRNSPTFEMDINEVTVGAYAVCVESGVCTMPYAYDPQKPWRYPGSAYAYASYPVYGVTLDQAEAFCAWAGKRVPNEDEWEKAMRGTDGRLFPWGNRYFDCTRANYSQDECGSYPHAVGSHPTGKSPYGVNDGIGNVGEITYSIYVGETAVVRGVRDAGVLGGYGMQRVSARSGYSGATNALHFGFRCARTPVD